jgi:hypothetical protein
MFSIFRTFHWQTNRSNSRLHLRMSTPTHLFYHSFWWNIYYPPSSHQFVLRPKFGSLIHGLTHPISVLYVVNNFLIILRIWVGLPQPSISGLLWCIYTYLLTFWVSIFYIVPIVMNTQIHKMTFMVYLHYFHITHEQLHVLPKLPHFKHLGVASTLSFPSWGFTLAQKSSLLTSPM